MPMHTDNLPTDSGKQAKGKGIGKQESGKKIADYLHLYIGASCHAYFNEKVFNSGGILKGIDIRRGFVEFEGPDADQSNWFYHEYIKPILRPLSDLTNEEAYLIADKATDWDRRVSYCVISIDKMHPGISILIHFNFPHGGIGEEQYERRIIINDHSMWMKNVEEPTKYDMITNSHEITRYLLSKSFDLFGLIEAGLAVDKTKL